jgi:hypothetical protein
MVEIKVDRRRGSRSHRVVPRNVGTRVPQIASCWRARGCGNETPPGTGLGRRHYGRRAVRARRAQGGHTEEER